jgi:WD40 repeat protein
MTAAIGRVGGSPAYVITRSDRRGFELRSVPDEDPLGGSTRRDTEISALALGENGILADGGEDHLIRLWDAETGKPLGVRMGHGDGPVRAVCAAEERVFSAGADGTVHSWGLHGGEDLGSVRAGSGPLTSIACARVAGQLLVAAGGDDGAVRVWDADRGALVHALSGHSGTIRALAMLGLGDQGLAASGGTDAKVRILDLANGTELRALAVPGSGADEVTGVALDLRDGRPVVAWCARGANGDEGTVHTADALSGEPLGALAVRGAPSGIALAGDVLAVCGTDGALQLWHAATGAGPRLLHGAGAAATCVALASERVAVGHADGTVRLWAISSGTLEAEIPADGGPVTSVAFGAGRVLVCGTSDGTVRVHDGAAVRVPTPHTSTVTALAVGGDFLASAGADGTLRTWRLPSGDPLLRIPVRTVSALALSSIGALAAALPSGMIRILDARTGTSSAELSAGGPVVALWLDEDGLVAGRSDGVIRIWQITAAKDGTPESAVSSGRPQLTADTPHELDVRCRPLAVARLDGAILVSHAGGLVTLRPEDLGSLTDAANRQLGLITSAQAARLGVTDLSALVELDWSVYQTADSPLAFRYAYPYAAWLALEPDRFAWERLQWDAVVSHESAAQLHGIGRLRTPLATLTAPADPSRAAPSSRESPRGIHVVVAPLTPDDIMLHSGVPVTTPLRTIQDLREVLDADEFDALVAEALAKGTVDRRDLPA